MREARSLAPREHGAYGQLAAPLVVALAAGRPGPGAILLGVAAVAAFAAQEPWRVALGHRGRRVQREDGPRAARRGVALGAVALGCGVVATRWMPPPSRALVLLPLALASVAAGLVVARREKTLVGELIAALTLASVAVPVAVAGGVSVSSALAAWASWSVGLAASTFAVRSVIHHARAPRTAWRRLLAPSALVLGSAAAVGAGLAPRWAWVAATPLFVASLGLAAWPPSPRHLRRVGWALVAATVVTGVLLVRE